MTQNKAVNHPHQLRDFHERTEIPIKTLWPLVKSAPIQGAIRTLSCCQKELLPFAYPMPWQRQHWRWWARLFPPGARVSGWDHQRTLASELCQEAGEEAREVWWPRIYLMCVWVCVGGQKKEGRKMSGIFTINETLQISPNGSVRRATEEDKRMLVMTVQKEK